MAAGPLDSYFIASRRRAEDGGWIFALYDLAFFLFL
jgi:hypothetical protein